jgi:hypothetical protein
MPVLLRRLRATHLLLIRVYLRIFSSAAKLPKQKPMAKVAQLLWPKKLAPWLPLLQPLVEFLLVLVLVDTLSVC